jgi:predicted permease
MSAFRRGRTPSGVFWCDVVARLAPGVSLERARAEVATVWPQLQANAGLPANTPGSARERLRSSRAFVGSLRGGFENVLRPTFGQPLLITFGLSVLMFAVCGANAANLLVAHGLARRREQTVRSALGASRSDLWRRTAVEVGLLMLSGMILAVPLAHAIAIALVDTLRSSYLELDLPSLWNWRAAAFLVVTIAASTVLVTLLSSVNVRRDTSLAHALRTSGRVSGYGRSRRLLLAAQIALAVMLVCSASTFVRTLQQYYAVDPGFAVKSVLAVPLAPLPGATPSAPAAPYYDTLLTRVQALPNVRSAGLSSWIPLGGPSRTETIESRVSPGSSGAAGVVWSVTDSFFTATGIPLIEGDGFVKAIAAPAVLPGSQTPDDAGPVARTAILSASLARRLFPRGGAVGASVTVGADRETRDVRIVGVAADARLGKPQAGQAPVIYLNFWEDRRAQRSPYLLVRAHDNAPGQLASAVAAAVKAEGREFALWTRTLSTQWDAGLTRERLLAGTSAALGLIGLTIAAVGIFGAVNHYVSNRRLEIGIRLAIGANGGDIARLLVAEVALLVGAGLLAGLASLFASQRAFASLLTGLDTVEPWVLAVTLFGITLVCLFALLLPLRRALRIDPLIALKAE